VARVVQEELVLAAEGELPEEGDVDAWPHGAVRSPGPGSPPFQGGATQGARQERGLRSWNR
jgi:hypothetical protein